MNDDSEMYDAIDSIPLDADGMADKVMAVVQNHVSENLVTSKSDETGQ